MYGTHRWLLGLENSLIKALHIVDDQSERVKTLDYISHGVVGRISSIRAIQPQRDRN